MAHKEELDELWGVTNDGGHTFIDRHGNNCGIRLWLDGHDFFNSKEEAKAFLKKHKDEFSNLSVVKLTFTVKVTAR